MTDITRYNDTVIHDSLSNASAVSRDIENLRSGNGVNVYSTFSGDDIDTRIAAFNAISDTVPLAEHLGEVIPVENVVIQQVEMLDEQTGEYADQARIILVSADGVNYHAVSKGLFTALRNIFAIIGEPGTWAEPLPLVVTEQRGKNGFRFFTARVAKGSKPSK